MVSISKPSISVEKHQAEQRRLLSSKTLVWLRAKAVKLEAAGWIGHARRSPWRLLQLRGCGPDLELPAGV